MNMFIATLICSLLSIVAITLMRMSNQKKLLKSNEQYKERKKVVQMAFDKNGTLFVLTNEGNIFNRPFSTWQEVESPKQLR
jgi:hypothetical protein